MPKNISISHFTDESVESIINGNTKYVVDTIVALPKKQAICAVARIVENLVAYPDTAILGRFMRQLETLLY